MVLPAEIGHYGLKAHAVMLCNGRNGLKLEVLCFR